MDVMVDGSVVHTSVNFWATWSDGSKETHVAADIRYLLPAAHTYIVVETQVEVFFFFCMIHT